MVEAEERVMEAEGRERLLAAALTAVLKERSDGDGGSGVIIGVDGEHYMFFTDGMQLHMTTVDKDDPFLALGMFGIDRASHSVN